MATCPKCNKPDATFRPRQSQCNSCHYEYVREWKRQNREKDRASKNKRNRRLRRELLEAYGHACECCGEGRFEFLALDHRHGGGEAERRRFCNRERFYKHIRDAGFPKDKYRLLCHNCNQSIGAYGYCPHQSEQVAAENLEAPQEPEGVRR